MQRYLRLYWLFLRNCVIREMMFRWNFIIRNITEIVWLYISILFWQVMFGYIHEMAGWSKYEVYFLVGTAHIVHQAFEGLFFPNCHQIPEYIRTGFMDFFLTKPANTQFMVSSQYIDLGSLTNVVLGFFIVGYAWLHLAITYSSVNILCYLLLLVNGMFIYYTIMFFLMTLSFWIVRADGLIGVYFNLTSLSRQPAEIYRGGLKVFLTFVFPMLVTINFPVKIFIGLLSFTYVFWGFTICAIFMYGTYKFWKFGVDRYQSASS